VESSALYLIWHLVEVALAFPICHLQESACLRDRA
jgi:hypothetical protein